MRQVCILSVQNDDRINRIPEFSVNPAGLTLAQRRVRGEAVWPALVLAHEEFVVDMKKIVPPERTRRIHEAIAALSEVQAKELRRSVSEIDRIFESIEGVDQNNARLRETETKARTAVDDLLRADPQIRVLYDTLPECASPPQATATPR